MTRPTALDLYRPALDDHLKKAVGDRGSLLPQMLHHQLRWSDDTGPDTVGASPDRVHGVLCLLAAEAAGAQREAALPTAAAIELLWESHLVHRDLREGNPGPTDRPSLWWTWGYSQGINAGDALYAQARLALMDLSLYGSTPEIVLRACLMLDQTCLAVSAAQHTLIQIEQEQRVAPSDYVEVIKQTDGAIAGTGAALGAMAAGATEEECQAVSHFGKSLGAAWRFRTELQNYSTPSDDRRTSVIENIDQRRSLPILYALTNASGPDLEALDRVASRSNPIDDGDIDAAISAIASAGGHSYVEALIAQLLHDGEIALQDSTLPSERTDELKTLGRYVAEPQDHR